MTLVKLHKTVERYRELVNSFENIENPKLELLRNLSFYCEWENVKPDKPYCCFNHIIGLPEKHNHPMPLFPYEKLIFDTLQNHKHIWIKKASGLGVTELLLRYICWLCLKDDTYRNSQMCIVTGPRIDLAISLVDRMRKLFTNLNCQFDTKETVLILNGTRIEVFPSYHLAAMRGLPNVKFIFLDEADFFPPGQQQEARMVSERYISKSRPEIVMVSTPNAPQQLFDQIEHEPEDVCIYTRMFLDYTYGVGYIFSEDEIAQAKRSPSFPREMDLKYIGLIGNIYHIRDIQASTERGKQIESYSNAHWTQKSMGVDVGFGSSAFAICITELKNNMVNVVYAEEWPRPQFDDMVKTTVKLIDEYNIRFENQCRIFIDSASPAYIRALKERVGEDINYEEQIAFFKKSYPSVYDLEFLQQNIFAVPIPFSKYHKEMLAHTKEMLEYKNGQIAIHPRFDKLITSLTTATEKGEGILDKEATSFDDLYDAFRLSLLMWK